MKISDKLATFAEEKRPFYSFEYFPPKTDTGLQNLYSRLDRMASVEPLFIDITWGAGGTDAEKTLHIAKTAQEYFGLDVLMHLTCTGLSKKRLHEILGQALESGIENILALRGDPPRGADNWEPCADGFQYASDLTKFIRQEFGDKFSVGVAGYPEGHFESQNKQIDLENLKHKVDAGADFVVTQLFYDMDQYFDFIARSKEIGIDKPIIPGLLPIHSYSRFRRFAETCQIAIPQSIEDDLTPIKNDDAKVQEYGVELCVEMCKKLLANGSPGLHFYTLNMESSVTKVLEKLGFLDDCRTRRALPWRRSTHNVRSEEDVRPIFWSNRPKSYLARTRNWDDFPNGRWGDSRSPSFGDLKEYYMLRPRIGLKEDSTRLRELYGEPSTPDEVGSVFENFCRGKINRLPWCEMPVHAETSRITDSLSQLNRQGFWTINSQPQVNGVSSKDPDLGWGGSGGMVYQKAYVEFFASPAKFSALMERLSDFPSITYHAINRKGQSYSNQSGRSTNAVTWGVFPGREILQPTIVDSEAFKIWKDEAFELWITDWRFLYFDSSPSYQLISEIYNSYFLVNLVENDFVDGDIFKVFQDLT